MAVALLVFALSVTVASDAAESPAVAAQVEGAQHVVGAQEMACASTCPARIGRTGGTADILGWATVDSPNASDSNWLMGVAAITSTDIWAVGYSGAALAEHWDGSSWTIVPTPSPPKATGSSLSAVAALSSTDVWAVGEWTNGSYVQKTLAEHWDGTSWTVVSTPSPDSKGDILTAVVTISAKDVWAIGDSSYISPVSSLIEHWDGTAWSVVSSPDPGVDNQLNGGAFASGTDVWAVGEYDDQNDAYKTLILHWDGAKWTQVDSPNLDQTFNVLDAVEVTSPDDVWAVGGYGCAGGCPLPLAEHWDGSKWTASSLPVPAGASGARLDAVTGSSPTDIWATGSDLNGFSNYQQSVVEHWNGSAWSVVPSPNPSFPQYDYLIGVSAISGSEAWAVGGAGPNNIAPQTFVARYGAGDFTSGLDIDVTPNPANIHESVAVSGTLTFAYGASATGQKVHINRTNPDGTRTSVGTVTIDSAGTYSTSDTPPDRGTYVYTATFKGYPPESPAKSKTKLTVLGIPSSLTLIASPPSLPPGGSTTLSGQLVLDDGANAGDETISIFETPPDGQRSKIGNAITDDEGNYSFPSPALDSVGAYTFESKWKGDPTHEGSTASTIVTVSANGKIAFDSNRTGNYEIFSINADGTGVHQLTNNPADDFDPAWSPDGTKVAFSSNRSGNYDVWTMNADGTNLINVTKNTAFDAYPSWSPDGDRLAFSSDRSGGNLDIWTVNLNDGTLKRYSITSATDEFPSWSPDGSKIAFDSDRTGNFDVFTMNASNGSGVTNITDNPASEGGASWSPDSSLVAFASDRTGDFDVYTYDVNTQNVTRLTNVTGFDGEQSYAPDGTKIAFMSGRAPKAQVWVMNADGSNAVRYTKTGSINEYPDWGTNTSTGGSSTFPPATGAVQSTTNRPTSSYLTRRT